MTENRPSEVAWLRWTEVMRKIASLEQHHDISAALFEIEAFLSHEENAELRNEALAYRADLKEQLGDLGGAEKDLMTARSLIGPSFGRYVRELSLGKFFVKQQRLNDAVVWYRTALQTCVGGEGVSGGGALRAFLELRSPESLTAEDLALCRQVAERSWRLLGLPDEPDLTNLQRVASTIRNGEARSPRRPKL